MYPQSTSTSSHKLLLIQYGVIRDDAAEVLAAELICVFQVAPPGEDRH